MFGKRFLQEYIFQIAVGVAVAATVAVSAVIAKIWTWPNAIVGGVLLLCGLLYLMDRLGIGPSARTRVRNWLDDSGFPIQTVTDNNAMHFVLVDNVGLYTHIIQIKSGDPINIAMPNLRATDKQIEVFNSWDKDTQQEFWKKVRFELFRARILFTDLKLEEGIALSVQVGLAKTLTGVEFMREVVNVRSTGRLYLELLNENIPEAKATISSSTLHEEQ